MFKNSGKFQENLHDASEGGLHYDERMRRSSAFTSSTGVQ